MIENQDIQHQLNHLNQLLRDHPVMIAFKDIQIRAQQHTQLKELEEGIKRAQKDAVQFAHYGKPEAEKVAIQQIQDLTKQYNEHPVVVHYRDCLYEANELLHYVTSSLQKKVNQAIEEGSGDAPKN